MARNNQQVQPAINKMAARFGYSPQEMLGIAKIESSLNPSSRTGSYKGLFQLSNEEFRRFGPKGGNIFNAEHNAMAAGALFNANDKTFRKRTGIEPTGQDRYMMHNQGVAGYFEHLKHPDRPAAENFAKASKWSAARAEKAIWGNMTPEMRAQFPGGVKTVKSSDFKGHWENRTAQFGIGPGLTGTPTSPAETARAVALQKAEDKRNLPLIGRQVLVGTGEGISPDDMELLDLRQTTLGDAAQRRIEADKKQADHEFKKLYGVTPEQLAAAKAATGVAPQDGATQGGVERFAAPGLAGSIDHSRIPVSTKDFGRQFMPQERAAAEAATGIRTRSVPVQTTAPETGAGRFAAPGLAGAAVPQSPSTMEGFMPPGVPNTTAGLIPGMSQPSLPEPTQAAAQAPLGASAPWRPPTFEEAQGATEASRGFQGMPQGLQEVPEGSQEPVQPQTPQGGPKPPALSSSPPARATAPQTQFDGWPDWAIKAFQMEPSGTTGGAPGGMPGAIPSTTSWMSQFPTFGSLFQSSPGGGFGGFAPVNLGGS